MFRENLQRFSLERGTAPNLKALVIKHWQMKLDDAAVKTAFYSGFPWNEGQHQT